jgi:hypothetical protein
MESGPLSSMICLNNGMVFPWVFPWVFHSYVKSEGKCPNMVPRVIPSTESTGMYALDARDTTKVGAAVDVAGSGFLTWTCRRR